MRLIDERKNFIFLILIFLSNAYLRFYFWPDGQPNLWGYFEALENHALEYLLNTGMKPPLMYFLHMLLAKIIGTKIIFANNILLISVIILDFISFFIIFYILRVTKVPFIICNVIILFYGFYQIPLEFWRAGTHYDSYSLFFNIIFALSITFFFKKQNWVNSLAISISGCLLILYGSVYILVVPISIIFCILCTMIKNFKFIRFFKISCLLLILPIIIGTSLCYKNYIYRNVFAPSTFGGVALMLTTMRTVDRNIIEGNKIVDNSSAPKWYKWCWNNADKFLPRGLEKDYVAKVNNKVFGQCLKSIPFKDSLNSINDAHLSHLNNKEFWPYDMSELQEHFSTNNFLKPLNAVNKDIDMMKNKKYLIWGMSPELSLHWTDLYGKEGGKIFWEDFSKNPSKYFLTFVTLFKEFTVDGSQFPLVLSKANARGGIYKDKFSNKYFTESLRFVGNVFQLSMLITLLSLIYLFIKLLIYVSSKKTNLFNQNHLKSIVFGVPAILITIIYSIIVGEENMRYLIYATPYFIISFAYLLPNKNKKTETLLNV